MRYLFVFFLTFFSVHFLLLAGCDVITTSCEGTDEDCRCAEDSDCIIAIYHSDVQTTEECYDLIACCTTDGVPLNTSAAVRNEESWEAVGCINNFDSSTCADCDAGDIAWAECADSICVKRYDPSSPAPGRQ